MVQVLLEYGADPSQKVLGKDAFQYAYAYAQLTGDDAVVQVLQAHETKRDPRRTLTLAPQAEVEAATPEAVVKHPDLGRPGFRHTPRDDDFALIVGVEGYSKLPSASFAEKDADAVKRYLLAMGLPPRNIIELKGQGATRGALQGYVEEWLPRNVKPASTVWFYYSGHGAPDPKTGQAYLVPWDGDAMFLQSTAYPVKQLYDALAKLPAKEVVVALDSCFSGAGGRSVLVAGARPLVTKVDEGLASGSRLTLFTAAGGDEITGTLEDARHGIFTYYLLRGLGGEAKDASGAVTAKGLYDYLKPHVQDEARRQNREQTPGLFSAADPRLSQF
jgi:hypothetical protein